MQKLSLFTLLLLILIISCEEKPDTKENQKSSVTEQPLERESSPEPTEIIKIQKGYLVSGNLVGNGGFLMKVSDDLSQEWYKDFDGVINSIDSVSDGYVFAGEGKNNTPWVGKVDKKGNMQWIKSVNLSTYGAFNKIISTQDGAFIVAGWKTINGSDIFSQGCVYKLDKRGEFDTTNPNCWEMNLNKRGNHGYDEVLDIIETKNSNIIDGYLLTGTSSKVITGEDSWIIKLDTKGNLVSKIDYSNAGSSCKINSVIELEDGYVGVGAWGTNSLWVVKTTKDLKFNLIDKKYGSTLGFIATANHVLKTSDGGFVVGGYDIGNNPTGWLMKFDKFELEWVKNLGPVEQFFAIYSVVETSDSNYILAGSVIYNAHEKKLLVVETDKNGECRGCFN